MLNILRISLFALVVSASLVPKTDDDPERYTVCGYDRGYVEKDSLEAANHLIEKTINKDPFFMAKKDCYYASRNTTIISFCNGAARDRNVNRAEVRRGIDQLIKDCGLDGGFTGFHVVNNLTFAAFGTNGGLARSPPKGSPPPDLPGGTRRRSSSSSSKLHARADCSNLPYDGEYYEDCEWVNTVDEDGVCGDVSTDNDCRTFCETKRRRYMGMETPAKGEAGQQQPYGTSTAVGKTEEFSVTTEWSVSLEGAIKDLFAVGVGYSMSTTETTGTSIEFSNDRTEIDGAGVYQRWVKFAKLQESCGISSEAEVKRDIPACPGVGVCPPAGEPYCGEIESKEFCAMSAVQDGDGNAQAFYALRYEYKNGTALEAERQNEAYKNACSYGDNEDGGDECYTDLPTRRRALHAN